MKYTQVLKILPFILSVNNALIEISKAVHKNIRKFTDLPYHFISYEILKVFKYAFKGISNLKLLTFSNYIQEVLKMD